LRDLEKKESKTKSRRKEEKGRQYFSPNLRTYIYVSPILIMKKRRNERERKLVLGLKA